MKRASKKQIAARKRAFLILRLRGMASLFLQLGNNDGLRAVDAELIKLNAATTSEHRTINQKKAGLL